MSLLDMSEKLKNYSGSASSYAMASSSSSKKHLSKKEIEDQRKKDEEAAAAAAYEEFVAAFEDSSKHGKAFVRGTTFDAGTREERTSQETGKLYKPPAPKIGETVQSYSTKVKSEPKDDSRDRSDKPGKKKEKEKKKSNLELFKEELRMIQEEREERHRLKAQMKDSPKHTTRFEPFEPAGPPKESPFVITEAEYKPLSSGSYDTGDPSTTNLYLGNLNPKMTEQQLCGVFGKYGPLASVKIMWPRSEEEKARGRNCGFVAYMNRKDGERALKGINGKDVMGYEMKLGWGKAVPLPPHPVYIPPALVELTMPPPPSGLPFNAQPEKKDREKFKMPAGGSLSGDEEGKEEFERILGNAVVKVVIPTDRNLLCLIHRMIEFVVREGPMFEAMVMNRELSNPMFRFLFENQSPAHVYYRWKLFSILQGDSPTKWRILEFRMFKGGSWWRPPPMNPYSQGMPEELVEKPEDPQPRKGQLSNSQRDRLESMLRTLTPERSKIADAMVYCIEHAEAAVEIVDCITESLLILHTALQKKVARVYLISDILHNCSVKIANASYYRKGFQSKLPDIFKGIREAHQAIEGRLKAEQFKQKIMGIFRAWEDWAIYPNDYLIKLQNVFLGLVPTLHDLDLGEVEAPVIEEREPPPIDDIDGIPIYDKIDLDGVPLQDYKEDLDGIPLNNEKVRKGGRKSSPKLKYAPSKWETVDPSVIEAQAMTTSKWDLLDQQDEDPLSKLDEEDLDGRPMEDAEDSFFDYESKTLSENDLKERETNEYRERGDAEFYKMTEERRAKLREIELKVTKFQDELEAGRRSRKPEMSITQQVEHYRQKLMRKEREKEENLERRKDHHRSISPDGSLQDKRSKHSSSPSPRRACSRSKSPQAQIKLRRSRSKSPPRRHQRSFSPRKPSHRSRSRSPKRTRRISPSPPVRRKRSNSRSPSRRSHKSRRSKH